MTKKFTRTGVIKGGDQTSRGYVTYKQLIIASGRTFDEMQKKVEQLAIDKKYFNITWNEDLMRSEGGQRYVIWDHEYTVSEKIKSDVTKINQKSCHLEQYDEEEPEN